jgi:hypothetical protein
MLEEIYLVALSYVMGRVLLVTASILTPTLRALGIYNKSYIRGSLIINESIPLCPIRVVNGYSSFKDIQQQQPRRNGIREYWYIRILPRIRGDGLVVGFPGSDSIQRSFFFWLNSRPRLA